MHLIRRSAFRVISAAAPSRAILASTPSSVLRSKTASALTSSLFRRAYSDGSSDRKPEAADGEQSFVDNSVGSSEGFQPRREYQQGGGDRGGYSNRGGDRGGYNSRDGRASDRRVGGVQGRAPREFAPRDVAPTNSIYVGNLLFDVTAKDIEREFAGFGTVKNVVVATDARGLSKGFGYVEFETVEEASAAIEGKNQTVFEGRRLVVNYQNKTPRERVENPPSKTLFIGNLAFEMSDADLNKLFRDIVNVIDVRVAIDRRTGQPRGFAHADFVDTESATKAKEILLGKEVYGRALRVDFSGGSRESRGDGPSPRRD